MDRYHMFCSYSKWKPTCHVIDEDQTGSWSTDNDILSQILKKYRILSHCNKADKNGIRWSCSKEMERRFAIEEDIIQFYSGLDAYAQQQKVNDEDINE